MSKTAIVQFNVEKQDEWYTPCYAIFPLLKYLKRGTTVWCPFDLPCSNFVKVLTAHGFKVIHSHITEGKDFFKMEVPDGVDAIISNPPYSKKTAVLKRLLELGLPFAMLIGCPGIFEAARFNLFATHGVEILVFDKRVSYTSGTGGQNHRTSPGFSSWYICHNMLPKQIVF